MHRERALSLLLLILSLTWSARAEAAPGAPRSLTASAASASEIDLTWIDGSRRESGFSIERSVGCTGTFVAIATTVKNTVSYRDGGLAAATTHCYRVRAFGRTGSVSTYSNVASTTTSGGGGADTTAPAVPTGLTAAIVGCSQVDLAWAPASDAGTGVRAYAVRRNGVLVKQVLAPATSTSDVGLSATKAYLWTISAFDGAGNESGGSQPALVTMPACPDQPPVANAGPDQFTQTLTAIPFDGTRSSDPDGTIASYAWTFGDGGTASGAAAVHTYGRSGTYTATLTVTDDRGLARTDTATVSVTNRPPHANAGPDQQGRVATGMTFAGSGSTDPDGSIASYRWTFGDGTSATGVVGTHAYAAAGTYTATLTTVDDAGASSSDTAQVTVSTDPSWTRTFGGPGDDRAQAVALDRDGNVAVTGYFSGTVDFGGGALTSDHLAWLDANQYKDIFVAKYGPSGAHLWSQRVGADSDDRGNAIATDGAGNVVVTGSVSNYVDFGNGVLTGTEGGLDAFVAKYAASDGHCLWAKRFGEPGIEAGYGVAVDANDDVVVVGHFQGTIDFGGGPLTASGGSTDQDIFVAKYAGADGRHLWSRRFGEPAAFDYAYGAAVDPSGNVLVAGAFYDAVDFGRGTLTSAGGYDLFVARYSSAGAPLWSKRAGGVGDDWAYGVVADAAGNATVTGAFDGAADFGGGTLTGAGGTDGFVARYAAADGRHLWSRRFGSTGTDRGQAVALDADGAPIVTGNFERTADFGSGSLTSAGGSDLLVAKYASTGAPQWSRRYGGSGYDSGQGVAADAGGNVWTAGYFQSSATFTGPSRTSAGGFDVFVFRAGP